MIFCALSLLLCFMLIWQHAYGHKWHYEWVIKRFPYTYRGTTVTHHERLIYQSYDFIYLDPDKGVNLCLPHVWAVILTAIPPAVFLVLRLLFRSRKDNGICDSCGYDLRATPRRCPECGKETPAPTTMG